MAAPKQVFLKGDKTYTITITDDSTIGDLFDGVKDRVRRLGAVSLPSSMPCCVRAVLFVMHVAFAHVCRWDYQTLSAA